MYYVCARMLCININCSDRQWLHSLGMLVRVSIVAAALTAVGAIYFWPADTAQPSIVALQTFALSQHNQVAPVAVEDMPIANYRTYAGVGCVNAASQHEALQSLAPYISNVPLHVKARILSQALPLDCTDTSAVIETQNDLDNGTEFVLAFWHTTCNNHTKIINTCVSISGSLIKPDDRTVGTAVKKTTSVVGFHNCKCIGGYFCQSCPTISEIEEHVPLKQPYRLSINERAHLERVTKTNAITRIQDLMQSWSDPNANLLPFLSSGVPRTLPGNTIAETA